MQISSKFTIAVHVLVCIDVNKDSMAVTSDVLAGSTGVNPVIVRNVLSQLKSAGIVASRQGSKGFHLAKPLTEVTLFDVYKAVDCTGEDDLFRFHRNPNPECPIGRNIHRVMDGRLDAVQKAMEDELRSTTVAQLVSETKALMGNASV